MHKIPHTVHGINGIEIQRRVGTSRDQGGKMFLLRGANPEKYRERTEVKGQVDVHHKFSGTMEELLATYRKLTSGGSAE